MFLLVSQTDFTKIEAGTFKLSIDIILVLFLNCSFSFLYFVVYIGSCWYIALPIFIVLDFSLGNLIIFFNIIKTDCIFK